MYGQLDLTEKAVCMKLDLDNSNILLLRILWELFKGRDWMINTLMGLKWNNKNRERLGKVHCQNDLAEGSAKQNDGVLWGF